MAKLLIQNSLLSVQFRNNHIHLVQSKVIFVTFKCNFLIACAVTVHCKLGIVGVLYRCYVLSMCCFLPPCFSPFFFAIMTFFIFVEFSSTYPECKHSRKCQVFGVYNAEFDFTLLLCNALGFVIV